MNTFAAPVVAGTITNAAIIEASGLGQSWDTPDTLFVHNDSGDSPRFFAIHTDASFIGTFNVANATAHDWEDMDTGPCPSGHCVFLSDSGDNTRSRSLYTVYRVPEPDIAGGHTSGTLTAEAYHFVYPDGLSYNCETMLVHPVTGQIYLLTKQGGFTEVYKFPTLHPANGSTSMLVKLARIQLEPTELATGGAIHPCANRFLLRTYSRVLELRVPEAASFESIFSATPVVLNPPVEGQGEAITYARDGEGFFTISEGKMRPLHFAHGH